MADKYKERLKHLANYLLDAEDMLVLPPQTIVFYDEVKHIGYECSYHAWPFLDLPWIFPGFRFEAAASFLTKDLKTGEEAWETIHANAVSAFIMLGPGPFRAGTCASLLHYLNLEPQEFLHLFGSRGFQQPDKFGGFKYPHWDCIKPRHIALNILEFIPKKSTMENNYKPDYRALRMFADFLYNQEDPNDKKIEKVTMTHKFKGGGYKKEFNVQRWVFDLMPDCFEQWYFDSFSGEPKYRPAESTDTMTDVFSWFEIPNLNAFEQMFTDKKVGANTTCREIANSILSWIKSKENEK